MIELPLTGRPVLKTLYDWPRRVWYTCLAIDIGIPDPVPYFIPDDRIERLPDAEGPWQLFHKNRMRRITKLIRTEGPQTTKALATLEGIEQQNMFNFMRKNLEFERIRDESRKRGILWTMSTQT